MAEFRTRTTCFTATAIIVAVASGCSEHPTSTPQTSTPKVGVSSTVTEQTSANTNEQDATTQGSSNSAAEDLSNLQIFHAGVVARAYSANEVAADASFQKRRFIVSGTVEGIGKDILNTPYVTLKGVSFRSVQCMFSDDAIPILSQLSPGDEVSIAGDCSGLMMNVLFRHCVLMSYIDPPREGITRKEMEQLERPRNLARARGTTADSQETQIGNGQDFAGNETRSQDTKAAERKAAEAKAAQIHAELEAQYRTWTSANGKFTTNARVVSYANGTITIETREGKKTKVPLDKLCDEDKKYIDKWRKAH